MPPGSSTQHFGLWVDYLWQGAIWPPHEQAVWCHWVNVQMTCNLEALSSELLPPQEGRSAGLLLELIEFLQWYKGLTLQIVPLSPTLLQNVGLLED